MSKVPFLTLVRPFGNGTSPLDQTILGEGKPNAWQEADAFLPPITVMTLFGVLVNRGGTEEKNNKISQRSWVQIPCGPEFFSGPIFNYSFHWCS